MTTRNEHTGDAIATKPASEAYRERWEVIFNRRDTPALTKRTGDGYGLCDKCDPDQCCRL